MSRPVRAAAIQHHSAAAEPNANISTAVDQCRTAVADGADLLILPELFAVQYAPFNRRDPRLLALAEPLDGPTVSAFREFAARHGVWMVVPTFERAMAGVAFDSAVLLDSSGRIAGVYRKTHVALIAQENSGQEKFYFREGNEFPVWDTPFGRLGVLICYDRNFPEAWRALVNQGAEIVAVPITTDGRSMFREVAQTMCYLNGVFGVFVNRVGVEADREFFGGSLICGPRGEVLAEAGDAPTVISAQVDASDLVTVRATMPFLRDARPEIYTK
ncbi:MAG: nitrilase-related carbon-nitrogen hydrolase [Chloroflexota bacterium]